MATGDFLDLATKGCYAAQRDPGNAYDLARAKELVNECMFGIIGTDDPWEFTLHEGQFTTTAGSGLYTYSSIATALSVGGIRDVMTLVDDSSGRVIPSMSWRSMEEMAFSTKDVTETATTPTGWAQWNQSIRIWPAPAAAQNIGCMVRLTQNEMTTDTEEPLLPLEWRAKLIVPYVAAWLLRQDGGGEASAAAGRFDRLYEESFRMLREAHATASEPSFRVVDPVFSDDLPGAYNHDHDPIW